MSAIQSMEDKDEHPKPTFDVNFGLNILACSLPFSTLLIIGIFSFSDYFINPLTLIGLGVVILAITFAPDILKSLSSNRSRKVIDDDAQMTIANNTFNREDKKNLNEAKAS